MSVQPFGEARLDAPMAGRSSARILVRNAPGTDGTALLYQAAREHLRAGDEVVWVALARPPARVRAGLARFGLKDQGPVFVDGHGPRAGLGADGEYEADPDDVAALAAILSQASRDHPDAWMVVDSLNNLPGQADSTAWARFVRVLRGHERVIALITDWRAAEGDPPVLEAFDHQLSLRGIEQRIVSREYVLWDRLDGRAVAGAAALPVRVQAPHGLRVYIPKVLVTGAFNAGKSRFVHSVSDSAVSAERRGTTVVMDRGHAHIDGLDAEVFGTPGQERFDPLLDTLAAQAVGVVLMVDAADPDSFPRAEQMLGKVWKRDLPVIVVANKQDLPDALPPEEVQARMSLPGPMPVIGCDTHDRESARAAFSVLVRRILGDAP